MTVIFDAPITRSDLRDRRVTIVGLGRGRTSAGLAQFLVANGARVTISDAAPRAERTEGIAKLFQFTSRQTANLLANAPR